MNSDAPEPHDSAVPSFDPAAETERKLKGLTPAALLFDRERFYFEAGRRSALAEIALASPAPPAVWNRRFLGAASHAAAALAAGVLVWLTAVESRTPPSGAGSREGGPPIATSVLPNRPGEGLAGTSPQRRETSLARWLDRLDSDRAFEASAPPPSPSGAAPSGGFRNDARTLQALLDARDA